MSRRNDDTARSSRPSDRDRDGFILEEGAGMLVLETIESANSCGVPVLAHVSGYSSINSCFHMTDIPENGADIATSVALALADAKLTTGDIDAINAHGSSTPQTGIAEVNAYQRVFGAWAPELRFTSVKSQVAHSLAASYAIKTIASTLSMQQGIVPPTINLESLDPRCPIDR